MTVDTDTYPAELASVYDRPEACAAALLCDDHDAAKVAFTIVEADLSSTELTYGELAERSKRFASGLEGLGVERGDCVAVLMGKSVELVVALLGIWRLGAVHVPLFTAFATPAIELRVSASGAKVVVTDADQRQKLDDLDGLIIVEAGSQFDSLIADNAPRIFAEAVGGDGTLVQLFTSGTTGRPKGVPVPLKALAAFRSYMTFGLDVSPTDVFWNAADPGWAYGLYYGILGPLAAGFPSLLLHAGFSADLTVAVIKKFGVTNFASAPTVYRSLSKDSSVTGLELRRASSAGEPLTPDVSAWAVEALGVEVRDHYGQTEQGMAIVNGWHDSVREPVKAGSMGKPLPGFAAGIVDGQIAIDNDSSPLVWFSGYVDAPEKTAERFVDGGRWYLTGDTGRVDDDGSFFFSARDDDVIIMAGYRIGPFDIESVLITHADVVDVAVVGHPDEIRGEVAEAYVVLADGVSGTDDLVVELQRLVKTQFAAHAYPRRVHFVDALPKTPSGKIQRFVLRKQRVR